MKTKTAHRRGKGEVARSGCPHFHTTSPLKTRMRTIVLRQGMSNKVRPKVVKEELVVCLTCAKKFWQEPKPEKKGA